MKRTTVLLVSAIVSVAVAVSVYAALQFFIASMAGSALVGVPAQVAAQRHYDFLSWLWFAVAVTAVLVFVVSVIGVIRLRSTGRMS
jgi:high-affinity nickel permease